MSERKSHDAAESMRGNPLAGLPMDFAQTKVDQIVRDANAAKKAREAVMKQVREYVTPKLVALYKVREYAFKRGAAERVAYVTADDLDRFLGEWQAKPIELSIWSNNWRVSCFAGKVWRRIKGMEHASTRDRMNGTPLGCWELIP